MSLVKTSHAILVSLQLDLMNALLALLFLPGSQLSWEVSVFAERVFCHSVFYIVRAFRKPSGLPLHQSKVNFEIRCNFIVRSEHIPPSWGCLQRWGLDQPA